MSSPLQAPVAAPVAASTRGAGARARASDQGGQVAVELALAAPVLVILIMAVVQFGITLNHWLTLTDAVRAGGRVAATCRFASGGTTAAVNAFKGAATDLSGVVDPTVGSCTYPGSITLTGTYPYSINVFGVVVKSGNLTASATERVE